MIDIQIIGTEQVQARLTGEGHRLHDGVVRAMTMLGIKLHNIVVDERLAGQVLKRQTGRLAQSQNAKTEDQGSVVTTTVGFNRNTVPYGEWHEFGVPHSWLIRAKRAAALRFEWHGEIVFRQQVTHPPLPERSFLRSSLMQIAPEVGPTIAAETAL